MTYSCQTIILVGLFFSLRVGATEDEDPSLDNPYESINQSVDITLSTIASKKQEKIFDAPGVISIITQDELKRYGGNTLGDILKRAPSLLGTTTYMTDRSILSSRGDHVLASSSHILLLLNGRPMREILEGGIKSDILESFPVNVIKRIEIIRGPGSVLYGSQAIASVINIITKEPDNNSTTLSGAIGNGLRHTVMADIEYKKGDVGVVIAGKYADNNAWKTAWVTPAKMEDGTNYKQEITIPDNGPGAYADLSFKDLNMMFSYNQWEHYYFLADQYKMKRIADMNYEAAGEAEWKKIFGDVGYKLNPVPWLNSMVNLTVTRSWFKTSDYPYISRDGHEILGEWANFINTVDNLNIIVGGVFGCMAGTEEDSRTGISYNNGHKQYSHCGYTQIDYKWNMIKTIGGLQVNKIGNLESDLNPRVGCIIYPLEHINIKMLYSSAYRAPSLNELYLDHPGLRGKEIAILDEGWNSSAALKPEKIYTTDIGINYQNTGVVFGINAFNSHMKNLIVQDRNKNHFSVPTWDNIREITIFGLECESDYYLTKTIHFKGSFLYQQSKDERSEETNVSPIPNFSVKGGLSYRSEWGLTISAFNTFQQALDKKFYSILNKNTKHFNLATIYCCYDLNEYFIISRIKELSLVLTIHNLLNKEVWLPAWGLSPGSMIPYLQGREVYSGFKVTF